MTTLKKMAEEYAKAIWDDDRSRRFARNAFLAGAEAVIDELRLRQSRCRSHEAINTYEFVINNLSEWKKDGGESE